MNVSPGGLFAFEYQPFEDITRWRNASGDTHLHWHALTTGWFAIRANGQSLMRYAKWQSDELANSPDYQAGFRTAYTIFDPVRELLGPESLWHCVAHPLPGDLAAWHATSDMSERFERIVARTDAATDTGRSLPFAARDAFSSWLEVLHCLWRIRPHPVWFGWELDMPTFHFLVTDTSAKMWWQGHQPSDADAARPLCDVSSGSLTMPRGELRSELAWLEQTFFETMSRRTDAFAKWYPQPRVIADITEIRAEHLAAQQKFASDRALCDARQPDWNRVRIAIDVAQTLDS
ncbi:MAG TPA: DUF5984 family protein [Phycisphaerales bacterium]|nr:DUF5984 family protein [Phycisphaerales bacterium]